MLTVCVCVMRAYCEQHRASIQFPNAHSDGIWSTFWTANDKILTGSVDEVAKAWCVPIPEFSWLSCAAY